MQGFKNGPTYVNWKIRLVYKFKKELELHKGIGMQT